MGFCLFEDAEYTGLFLAVNSDFVDGFEALPKTGKRDICKIVFTQPVLGGGKEREFKVVGTPEALEEIIYAAAKIGLQKANLNILRKLSAAPMPLLINNPGRIMVMRELLPEKFMDENPSITTASILYYSDGATRFISERPGQFVYLTNRDEQVPILKQDEEDE